MSDLYFVKSSVNGSEEVRHEESESSAKSLAETLCRNKQQTYRVYSATYLGEYVSPVNTPTWNAA